MSENVFIKGDFIHPDYIEDEYRYSCTYNYLERYVNDRVFADAEEYSNKNQSVKMNRTIWSLWWQGEKYKPMLVQRCMESVRNNKPDRYDYICITEDNANDYVSLPDYIWEKYKNGTISTTHLSDILRIELLYQYGGCWIDATVFCNKEIPRYFLDQDLFFFQSSVMDKPVHKGSSWWLCGKAGNRLVRGTRNVLLSYWKREERLIDYYLLHAVIAKLMDTDNQCCVMRRTMPYFNNSTTHTLWGKLDDLFDENEWEWIKASSMVHKLSYKQKHILGDSHTYYWMLINRTLI